MNIVDPKRLKKLAETCRKAGIKHFKSDEFEFTLGDLPLKTPRRSRAPANVSPDYIATDAMTPADLLMWSSAPNGIPFGEGNDQM